MGSVSPKSVLLINHEFEGVLGMYSLFYCIYPVYEATHVHVLVFDPLWILIAHSQQIPRFEAPCKMISLVHCQENMLGLCNMEWIYSLGYDPCEGMIFLVLSLRSRRFDIMRPNRLGIGCIIKLLGHVYMVVHRINLEYISIHKFYLYPIFS
jgi:hypothetical protein